MQRWNGIAEEYDGVPGQVRSEIQGGVCGKVGASQKGGEREISGRRVQQGGNEWTGDIRGEMG